MYDRENTDHVLVKVFFFFAVNLRKVVHFAILVEKKGGTFFLIE